MSFTKQEYTKSWTSAANFPTVENSESQVRADMQFLPDEILEYLHDLIDELEATTAAGNIGVAATGITASTVKAALEELYNNKATKPDLGTISLSATWTGSASPYTQTVTVSGATVTSNSKVDMQPNSTVIAQLAVDKCKGLYIVNNDGTLTVYAVGSKPTVALSDIQVTVTEVTA